MTDRRETPGDGTAAEAGTPARRETTGTSDAPLDAAPELFE